MKKTLLILFILGIFSPTCKKISKYPIRMNGIWYAPHSNCGMVIEIDANGYGRRFGAKTDKGCNNGNEHGKVKFTKHKLYIGYSNYKIIEEPGYSTDHDSIIAPVIDNIGEVKKYKVYAIMKLRDSFFNGKNEEIYYKYMEY